MIVKSNDKMKHFSEEKSKDNVMTSGLFPVEDNIENKDCGKGDKDFDNDIAEENLKMTRSPGLTSFFANGPVSIKLVVWLR